jgi:Rrf2 family protein
VFRARHGGDGFVNPEAIVGAEGLLGRFLQRVLEQLAAAGAVRTAQGPHGGCHLARPSGRITLLDVVEAIDVPVCRDVRRWTRAVAGVRFDARLQAVCDAAAEVARRRLRRVTLAELAGDGRLGQWCEA